MKEELECEVKWHFEIKWFPLGIKDLHHHWPRVTVFGTVVFKNHAGTMMAPQLVGSSRSDSKEEGEDSGKKHSFNNLQNLWNTLAKDILHPSAEDERKKHKKKRLVQNPNSYFMDVKCPGCYKITTVFSHAQTVVLCVGCSTVLCQPTGGKARLTEGCSFRRKQH
ncbi:ribosomal protein eS27-like [Pelodytes ibericus]